MRLQNVYGEGQSLINPYTGILSIFSNRILTNSNIEIFEDGQQTRDFVHVSDVVSIIKKIIDDEFKIKNDYKFSISVDFKEGVNRYIDWVKNQDIVETNYENTLNELRKKGLLE